VHTVNVKFNVFSARQHTGISRARYMLSPVRLSVCPTVRLSVRHTHTGGSVKNGWS